MDVGLLGTAMLPPVPFTMLHWPVPALGALPARATCVWPQVAAPVWLGPALAIVGSGFTVTVMFPQVPGVTHPPSPRTWYVVVELGDTVILVPLPTDIPPQEPAYHCQAVAPFRLPEAMLRVVD